ncbi:MAG: 3-keto-5-aminohexanoate cleavage protein [Hoeflea sp.]|uniref:3-keto-5-aminohexanoate cleavage protein n=1 Tax=Hoeflea sp. TaxID=1940281 RepID=UPI00329769A8|tara:strand:+ start:2440 stop:3366 length:927 start_codon:yes stop_codon:yes gene_type:complete
MSKIIITCAVTGSIHTPSMSPYLPVTAEAIANQAIGAAKAGAAILHLHARHPANGRPSALVEHYMAFLPAIRAGTDAVVNLTTGGSAVMSMQERLAGPVAAEPEMCSLNMGTMNFALYPMLGKRTEWLYDWEEPFLRQSDDMVFKNTPRDIESILRLMGRDRGARFEFECYDLSHLQMLDHFVGRDLITGPIFIQFVMGVLGGVAAEPEHLAYLKQTADRLFGDDYMFSVLAAGRLQMPMARLCASMGGHVRVGLEDNLYIASGELARSNAEQVDMVRQIVEAESRVVATPDEARMMLGLKGKDKVGF